MFFCFLFFSLEFSSNYGISVESVAQYGDAPLFEQVFYFINDHSTELAKQFLLNTLENADKLDSYDYILSQSEKLLSKDMFSLLKAELKIKSLVAKVEYAKQIPDKLSPKVYTTDFVLGNPSYVFFVNIHVQENAEKVLNMIKNNENIHLRFDIPTQSKETKLRGYGVSIRPNLLGDEKFGQKNIQPSQNNVPQDITLANLENNLSSHDEFKINKIDMHLKIIEYIRKNKGKPILTLLRDITNNWPAFAKDVFGSEQSVDTINFYENLRKHINNYEDFMTINGRKIVNPEIDIFTLLNIIKTERKFRDILSNKFKLNENVISQLSHHEIATHQYFFDYRVEIIDFLNDIELDPQFEQLSTQFEDLLKDSVIPLVRKNLVDFISYIDPTTHSGNMKLQASIELLNRGIPVRVGIVPHFNLKNRLSRKIAFAYHHLALKNSRDAIAFLQRLRIWHDRENLTLEESASRAYDSINNLEDISWNDIHKFYTPDTPEFQRLNKVHQYYQLKGIKPNTVSINGRIEEAQETSHYYVYYCKSAFNDVKRIVELLDYDDFPTEDPIALLDNTEFIVNNLKGPISKNNMIVSLDLYHQKITDQISFIEDLEKINWKRKDSNEPKAYYILLTNSSRIEPFNVFMAKSHKYPSAFAVNPDIEYLKTKNYSYPTLICGGRVYENIELTVENLEEIENWFAFSIGQTINPILESANANSSLYFYLSTIICDWQANSISRSRLNNDIFTLNSEMTYESNDGDIVWEIALNPLTKSFQRMIDIIKFVDENKLARVKLVINPSAKTPESSLAIDYYYRSSLDSDNVLFTQLNESNQYFMILDSPSSWISSVIESDIDTNNIKFEGKQQGLYNVKYQLNKVSIEGSLQYQSSEPCGGALMNLGSSQTVTFHDNGYWQFDTNIGPHSLLFQNTSKDINIDSFGSNMLNLQVDNNYKSNNFNEKTSSKKDDDNINIFVIPTDASDEKFAKVMMISVLNNTKSKVKFWILREFVSQEFAKFLHKLSTKYNSEYEFIGYKWPEWLHPETSLLNKKMGYKILFLDVLFPIKVSRIIYIDSKSVIRGDVSELNKLDIGEHPYAFPTIGMEAPREDTKSNRYWFIQQNKIKYYSARLFIADLDKMRNTGTSNLIRYYYQRLSSEYNRLIVLDQDVINFITEIVPARDIPEKWLWCSTWSSMENFDNAKNIDLCPNHVNNIQLSEFANENVPEWNNYVEIIDNF